MTRLMLGNHEMGIQLGTGAGIFVGQDTEPIIPYVPPVTIISPIQMVGTEKIKILKDETFDTEGNTLSDLITILEQDMLFDPIGGQSYPAGSTYHYAEDSRDEYMINPASSSAFNQCRIGVDFSGPDLYYLSEGCSRFEVKATGQNTSYVLVYNSGYHSVLTLTSDFTDIMPYIGDDSCYISHSSTSYSSGKWDVGDSIIYRWYYDPSKIFIDGYVTSVYLNNQPSRTDFTVRTSIYYKDGTIYTPTEQYFYYPITPEEFATIDFIEEEQICATAKSSGSLLENSPRPRTQLTLDAEEVYMKLSYEIPGWSSKKSIAIENDTHGYMDETISYAHCVKNPTTGYLEMSDFTAVVPNGKLIR